MTLLPYLAFSLLIPIAPAAQAASGVCSPQPLPPALEGAGYSNEQWPRGETIRFSAAPSFSRISWAVQFHRSGKIGATATVRVVKLLRQRSCNRHTRVGEWTGTLPASEATRFFELAAELEPKADEEAKRVLVTDGTMFEFVHKQRDQLRRTRMSAAAQGDSGRLARLMLDVAARFVRRGLPNSPDWKASEPPVDTTSGPALSPPPMIDDSHHSDRTRVSYAFNCAGMKIRLGYRQEERDLDSVGGDMARALPVDLTGIEVSGRRISAQDRRTIEDLMRSFARIEYVTAECFDREVTLTVKGMNLQRWLDYFRPAPAGVRKERPVATVREIRISAAGAVSIS